MTDPTLADVLHEIRALRFELLAMVRGHVPTPDRRSQALLDALEAYFGEGRFTVAGLLAIAADDPHSDLAVALAEVVDLNASPRSVATRLGALLARCPDIEVVAECRGSAVYRLVRT